MEPFRGAPPPAGSPGGCPRCRDPHLEPRASGELRVASCRGCGGVWIDGPGMLALFGASDAELRALASRDAGPPRDRDEPAPCPRCRVTMRREVGASGVAYDSCGRHGLWFDRGELAAMLRWAGAGVPEPASAAETAKEPLARLLRSLRALLGG